MHELDCLECLAYERLIASHPVGDRGQDPRQPKSTHCKSGHELTDANTIIVKRLNRPSETRTCRTCNNERQRIAWASRRAETTRPREPWGLDRGRAAPTGRMTPQTLPVEGHK